MSGDNSLIKTKRPGFTLIELLVVIAIIGLLSTLAVVSLNGARSKARDARRVSDLRAVSSALELYRDDNNDLLPAPDTDWNKTIGINLNAAAIYLPAGAPVDPDSSRTGNDTYIYCSDGDFYLLHALLENTPPGSGLNGTCSDQICGAAGANCINQDGAAEAKPVCDGDINFCLGRL